MIVAKNTTNETLHEAMHRIPGVPEHNDNPQGGRANPTHSHPRRQNRTTRHDTPPRVLVGWQNRIARLFGR